MSAVQAQVCVILISTVLLTSKVEAEQMTSCKCSTPPPCPSFDARKMLHIGQEQTTDPAITVRLSFPIISSASVCVDSSCSENKCAEETRTIDRHNNTKGHWYLDIFTCKDPFYTTTTEVPSSPATSSSSALYHTLTSTDITSDQTTLSSNSPEFNTTSSPSFTNSTTPKDKCQDGHCCPLCYYLPIVVVVLSLSFVNTAIFMVWYRFRAKKVDPGANKDNNSGLVILPFGLLFGLLVWYRDQPKNKDPEAKVINNNNQTCDKTEDNQGNIQETSVHRNELFEKNEQDLNGEKEELSMDTNQEMKTISAKENTSEYKDTEMTEKKMIEPNCKDLTSNNNVDDLSENGGASVDRTNQTSNGKLHEMSEFDGADIAKIATIPKDSNC